MCIAADIEQEAQISHFTFGTSSKTERESKRERTSERARQTKANSMRKNVMGDCRELGEESSEVGGGRGYHITAANNDVYMRDKQRKKKQQQQQKLWQTTAKSAREI